MSNLNSLINSAYQEVLSETYGVSCTINIADVFVNYWYKECDNCTDEEPEDCTFSVSAITGICNFSVEEL